MKVKKCPECSGKGKVVKYKRVDDILLDYEVNCHICEGHGKFYIKEMCGLQNDTICKYRLDNNECYCKDNCELKQK